MEEKEGRRGWKREREKEGRCSLTWSFLGSKKMNLPRPLGPIGILGDEGSGGNSHFVPASGPSRRNGKKMDPLLGPIGRKDGPYRQTPPVFQEGAVACCSLLPQKALMLCFFSYVSLSHWPKLSDLSRSGQPEGQKSGGGQFFFFWGSYECRGTWPKGPMACCHMNNPTCLLGQ